MEDAPKAFTLAMMRFTYAAALILLLTGAPVVATAATIQVTPASVSVHAGDIVTVRLIANTQGAAINQGEGTLRFPTDMLDVVSASKAGSIFTLWVEEPAYSNGAGTVHFDGGVPTPGYTGSAGTMLAITFHAKKAGTATLSLTDSALRANDGFGTDVLTASNGGVITITETVAPAPTPATPAPATPSAPVGAGSIASLTSSTHSDQTAWYQNENALMTWQLPAGATAVQTIVDRSATAAPSVEYKPAIVEKRVTNLADGVWYFGVRAKVGGAWGPVARYTLQIDRSAPELASTITLDYDEAAQDLLISGVSASDEVSGIDHYELSVDGKNPLRVASDAFAGGSYRLHYAKTGTHSIQLRAYDKAGNHTEASGSFNTPTPLADQTLWRIGGLSITFAWFILLVLLISLVSLAAAATAWYKLYMLRAGAKSRVEKRDKMLHRSLRIYKEELERHLRTLERAGSKRELTDEEADLNEDLKKNVDDLERYLTKEFKKYD